MTLTDSEYRTAKKRCDAYEEKSKQIMGGKRNYLTGEESARLPPCTNEDRSAIEEWQWKNCPPEKYFGYIDTENKTITTWMGEKLGDVEFGVEFGDIFGGRRVPIRVSGTNGINYYGYYFKSSGDYARIQANKGQDDKFKRHKLCRG